MRTGKWMVLVAGLVVAAMLVGCGGGPEPAAQQPSTEQPEAGQPAAEGEGKAAPVEVGTAVTVGDWTLKAKEVERDDSAGGAKAEAGQELLVITFDLTNNGAADQGTGPAYFKLRGSDGIEIQAAPTGEPEYIFNTPQPIKAGETREIRIVYAVPAGATGFQWTFEPFVEGGAEPAVVNIP